MPVASPRAAGVQRVEDARRSARAFSGSPRSANAIVAHTTSPGKGCSGVRLQRRVGAALRGHALDHHAGLGSSSMISVFVRNCWRNFTKASHYG